MQTRPPQGRHGGVCRGQAVDVEVSAHRRASARSTSCTFPLDRDVRMIMTSQDVIHSFYVPAFRIKADVLPGRYTSTWFHATDAGTLSPVLRGVLRHAALGNDRRSGGDGTGGLQTRWAAGGSTARWLRRARRAFQQYGCSMCHRADYPGTRPEPGRACSASRCCWTTDAR